MMILSRSLKRKKKVRPSLAASHANQWQSGSCSTVSCMICLTTSYYCDADSAERLLSDIEVITLHCLGPSDLHDFLFIKYAFS